MKKLVALILAQLLSCPPIAPAQMLQSISSANGLVAITVEATCSGSSNTQTVACSSPMTVTAGDTIVCNGSAFGSDPMTIYFNDTTNGFYDNIEGVVHPGSANAWVATGVFVNSAGGSITPQVNDWEAPFQIHIKCRALKGTRTTLAIDGGSVNQTQSTTAANPTSGTAAAPTNSNEIVIGAMARSATATTSDSAPWTPGGTITAIGTTGNYVLYDHYSIQTTAATANSPMTSSSAAYIDTQYAVLNASNPAGYRGITGYYGVPAIAKTNATNATAADLNGSTTTLETVGTGNTWSLTGTVGTYDTSVTPSGTGALIAEGVPHTFGDAATSIKVTGTATTYERDPRIVTNGAPIWFSSFFRVASASTSTGQICDSFYVYGGGTETSFFIQTQYDVTNNLQFMLEPSEGARSPWLTGFSLDTDYRLQVHIAGSGERYHQLIVQSKSGGVWSVAGTRNYDVLCTVTNVADCVTPTATGQGTGSASSGTTSLTITSGSGTISAGQVVYPQTGIDYLTQVESVSGTCSSSCTVTLSQNTSASVSGTVKFIAKPTNLIAATITSLTAGSTAATIVAPVSGTIATKHGIGGTGIQDGTYVSAISGTSLTLSQPATATTSNTGLWFWQSGANLGLMKTEFGKWSSCTIGGAEYFSGMHFDPVGSWGAYLPN